MDSASQDRVRPMNCTMRPSDASCCRFQRLRTLGHSVSAPSPDSPHILRDRLSDVRFVCPSLFNGLCSFNIIVTMAIQSSEISGTLPSAPCHSSEAQLSCLQKFP